MKIEVNAGVGYVKINNHYLEILKAYNDIDEDLIIELEPQAIEKLKLLCSEGDIK